MSCPLGIFKRHSRVALNSTRRARCPHSAFSRRAREAERPKPSHPEERRARPGPPRPLQGDSGTNRAPPGARSPPKSHPGRSGEGAWQRTPTVTEPHRTPRLSERQHYRALHPRPPATPSRLWSRPPRSPALLPRPLLGRARPKAGASPPGGSGRRGTPAHLAARPPSAAPAAPAPQHPTPRRFRRATKAPAADRLRRPPAIKPVPKAERVATYGNGGMTQRPVRNRGALRPNAPLDRTVTGSDMKGMRTENEREATRGRAQRPDTEPRLLLKPV